MRSRSIFDPEYQMSVRAALQGVVQPTIGRYYAGDKVSARAR